MIRRKLNDYASVTDEWHEDRTTDFTVLFVCYCFVIQTPVFLPDPDCPYLDKATWCEMINGRECYANENTCCISCKKFIKPQNDYGGYQVKDGELLVKTLETD